MTRGKKDVKTKRFELAGKNDIVDERLQPSKQKKKNQSSRRFSYKYTGLFEMIVRVLKTCHTQFILDRSIRFFYLIEQHSKFLLHTVQVLYMCTLCDSTGLFEMIVEVLKTCNTQYTSDSSICVFLFTRTTLPVFVT